MFDPKKYTINTAKPLPVILLLDVSGSMQGDKIANLNQAVEKMIETFVEEEKMETEIHVSVITFGNNVNLHLPLTKASQVKWQDLSASGSTPMGVALRMAKDMIEDRQVIPSRAYRPTLVLVSDGMPDSGWEGPLNDIVSQGRSSKCDRMAMAIGHDANEAVLKKFIKDTDNELLYAENASKLHEGFKKITMSVTLRTRSQDPNKVISNSEIKLDDESIQTSNRSENNNANNEGYEW